MAKLPERTGLLHQVLVGGPLVVIGNRGQTPITALGD